MTGAKTPEEMAAVFVQMAQAKAGLSLDYSMDSLAQVDALIGGFHDNGDRSDALAGVVTVTGAYVGEVLRRALGASWVPAAESQMMQSDISQEMMLGTMRFLPAAKVAKRLDNGPEDDLMFYAKVLMNRAAGDPLPDGGGGTSAKPKGFFGRLFGR